MKPRYKWQPLQRADYFAPIRPEMLRHTMEQYGLDEAGARALLDKELEQCETWVNDLYQVQKRYHEHDVIHLNIRRRDGAAMVRDWRHFQLIKNQLLGPECEAVELFPAESRLVDSCNKYHLYGSADPTYRFPFGWQERDVSYEEHRDIPGMRQRPL
jgi:hypothetical protein